MGIFADLYAEKGAAVPSNKKEEFAKRIEKLYQVGGMMNVEFVQLCGKSVETIRKAKMSESGMDFTYNYFEDDRWENAGFNNKNGYVWSNKIGWRQFHMVVVAAYVLEEMYTDGTAVATVDGKPVTSWGYVGWINYLFKEHNHVKNYDLWKLFEVFHYSEKKSVKGLILVLNVMAILEGVKYQQY